MPRFLEASLAVLAVTIVGIANADKLGFGKSSAAAASSSVTNARLDGKRDMPKNDDFQSITFRGGSGGGSSPSCCPADVNCDGVIDATDLATLLGAWGACPGCAADINQDGVVDASDLASLLGAWGPCVG